MAMPGESVSLAEGPGGTVLAAFVSYGDFSLRLFDAELDELAHADSSVAHPQSPNSTRYQSALSAVTLSQTTIGSVFAIAGRFDIPDGHFEKLAYGTLCFPEGS
jgi:hypothetical protein